MNIEFTSFHLLNSTVHKILKYIEQVREKTDAEYVAWWKTQSTGHLWWRKQNTGTPPPNQEDGWNPDTWYPCKYGYMDKQKLTLIRDAVNRKDVSSITLSDEEFNAIQKWKKEMNK